MKYIVKKSEVTPVNEDNSQFYEYDFSNRTISVGVSEINGRYPKSGFEVDEEIEAYWYVASGAGTIWICGSEHLVEEGDMIAVPKGEKYWVNGDHLRLVVCGTPVWNESQHKHFEK